MPMSFVRTDLSILQILPSLDEGGTEQSTIDIAKALEKTTAHSLVISGGGLLTKTLASIGCAHYTIDQLGSRSPIQFYENYRTLDKILKETKPTLIHARSRIPAWLISLLYRRHHIPWLATWHGTHEAHNPFKKFFNTSLLRGDLTIVSNQTIRRKITEQYSVDPQRIRVIPRGIDTEYFNPRSVSPQNLLKAQQFLERHLTSPHALSSSRTKPLILILPGRLTKWKGHHFALQALQFLKGTLGEDNWHCFFIGIDEKNKTNQAGELQADIAKSGLGKNVTLTGHCTDMPAIYQLADIVLIPSLRPEPFGRTIAEAQAMEKATLCLRRPLGNHYFEDNQTGFICPERTPQSFAQTILGIARLSPPMKRQLGQRARGAITAHYSLYHMQQQTLHLYDELLRERGIPSALEEEFACAPPCA